MAIGNAVNVGGVVIDIRANGDQFRMAMAAADAQAKRSGASMQGALAKVDNEAKKLHGSLGGLHTVLGLIGGVAIVKELADTADAFSLMRSRIRLVINESEDLYDIEEKLTEQALRNRAALKPTIDLYTRLRQSRKDLTDAATQELVDRWSKSLIISASSASEAASSTLQFSQAMAAGVLQGQELRSVIQGNSAFAVYLAEGLGITTGELKAMGETGEISLNKILDAMKRVGNHIDHDFAKKALTIHQAFINLETSVTRFVGLADQGAGASAELAKWINIVATNFDTVAKFAIAAGQSIAGAFATGLVIQFAGQIKNLAVALRAATTAGAGLGLVMNFLGGPWGIALGAIVAGVAALNSGLLDNRTQSQRAADAMVALNDEMAKTDSLLGKLDLSETASEYDAMQESANKAADEIERFNEAMKASGAAAKGAAYADLQRQISAIIDETNRLEADMNATERVFVERGMSFTAPKYSDAQKAAMQSQIDANRRREADARRRADEIMKADNSLFKSPDAGDGVPAAAPATAKAIQQLTGYYTALENLERNLADIRSAEAEGATGASRAAVQAMLDYYDATGDVFGVLTRLRDLQRYILSETDASLLDSLITTLEATKIPSIASLVDDLAASQGDLKVPGEATYAGQEAEQRLAETIANATRTGLVWGIESGDWGDVFASILGDSVREALTSAIDALFQVLEGVDWGSLFGGSSSGTGWGGFFDAIGGMWEPRSGGGPVSAGKTYRVGEMGSEWFVPSTDGFIVPNNAGASVRSLGQSQRISVGGAQIIINGNADSVTRQEIAQTMDAWGKGLPSIIDSRLADRRTREGW